MDDARNTAGVLDGDIDPFIDLVEEKWSLEEHLPADLVDQFTDDDEIIELNYPVITYPQKVKSLSFDKLPKISGKLEGIKGQYLLFEGGQVLNIRKHTGYYVEVEY